MAKTVFKKIPSRKYHFQFFCLKLNDIAKGEMSQYFCALVDLMVPQQF